MVGIKKIDDTDLWQPKMRHQKHPSKISAWSVAIPNLPLLPTRGDIAFVKWISELPGHACMFPCYPHGTLILFYTEEDAKSGREAILNYPGYAGGVGNNITLCYVDKKYVPDWEKHLSNSAADAKNQGNGKE